MAKKKKEKETIKDKIEKQISRTKVCRAVQKISGGFGRFLRGKSETGRDDTSV